MTKAENTRMTTKQIKHIGDRAKNQRDNTGYLDNKTISTRPTQQNYQDFTHRKQQKEGIYLQWNRWERK